MRYVVTAPPGGLGHFLARVLANEYDFSINSNGSYHGLTKNYSSQTTKIENTESYGLPSGADVICLHNFDNRDLTVNYPDRKIVNIVIDNCYDIFLNNFFRKAVQTTNSSESEFKNNCRLQLPNSPNSLRETFFFLYQSLVNNQLSWVHNEMSGTNVNFSGFYTYETFQNLIQSIEGPQINLLQIWRHFISGQQAIMERVGLYNSICQTLIDNKVPVLPSYFDDIDYGIMCSIIFDQTGKDLLNLENSNWL